MMQSLKPWQNDVNRALPNRFQEKSRIICLFSTKVFCLTFWSAVSRNQFGDVDPKQQSLKEKNKGRGNRLVFAILWTDLDVFSQQTPVTGFPDHYRVWEMSTIQPSLVDLQGAQPYDDKVDMP